MCPVGHSQCEYVISSLTVLTGLAQRFQTKRKVFLLVYGYAALCHAGLFSELVCWLIYAQLHYYRTAAYSVVNVFGRT